MVCSTTMASMTMAQTAISDDVMYSLLVRGISDYAIYMLDRDGVVLNWNIGAERAKGYRADEIIGRNFETFYCEKDRARGVPKRNLDVAFANGSLTTEGWRLRKDQTKFWARVSIQTVRDDDGRFVGFAKITKDCTRERFEEEAYRYQASRDPLTGVRNRASFMTYLEDVLPQIYYGGRLALHYVDVDRFKPVNDTLGHAAGDDVLREVASRLCGAARAVDHVGRLGGDEFVVLQTDAYEIAAVETFASRIIDAIERPIKTSKGTTSVSVSIGTACAPDLASEADCLLSNADVALYSAKSAGRARFAIFEPSMAEVDTSRRLMEIELRMAIATKAFELNYQPMIDTGTKRIVGHEALLRWRNRKGEFVPPDVFIPLAEKAGMMIDIGTWVLQEACREAATWTNDHYVSVNVSATQISDVSFVSKVQSALESSGLEPRLLELELTETSVLENIDNAIDTLSKIREMGIGVALDDFGTGYSSLSMLRRLPLTRMKIDRSFTNDIDGENASIEVIRAIVSLGHAFGLQITAEGVETELQMRTLGALRCETLQGFLLGKPSKVAVDSIRSNIQVIRA